MRINVSFKPNHEVSRQLSRACNEAVSRTASAVLEDIKSRGVVPKDTGELERSGYDEIYGMKARNVVMRIVFSTPYARRWYFNVDKATFQQTKNMNAQDHWMDYYLDGEGLQWVLDTFSKFLKEESKGLIT